MPVGSESSARGAAAERIRVSYRLLCGWGADPHSRARDIAFEQTVELPEHCVPAPIRDSVVGRIECVAQVDSQVWTAIISYPASVVSDLGQLVNLLFGNISLKSGVQVFDVELPPSSMSHLTGPSFGVTGLRRLCGVGDGALSCAALKPLGLSTTELAQLCRQFALGGIDIIKDDHSLTDQESAPFRERVAQCQQAVERANRETGGSSRYFPNLPSSWSTFDDNLAYARSVGVTGVLVSPLLIGLDAVRCAAAQGDIALLGHPALSGAFFQPDHGIAPDLLLGKLFRLIGCDGVIYPNVGGRFVLSEGQCTAINGRLREPLGHIRRAFPVPAGGIDMTRVPYWLDRYGPDTIFLVGGSLYSQGDLVAASRILMKALGR
ncbi:MAG: ribulose 1,5-bisphosphate carboxylase [Gemmatimonadota bacterium]|nr:MAG: ribulose 1,5-bisphosphate carboxylase [Gemmatimonadota bacterium]